MNLPGSPPESLVYGVDGAAKDLNCGHNRVRELCRDGFLRHFRNGPRGKILIPRAAILDLVEKIRRGEPLEPVRPPLRAVVGR